MLDKLVQLFIDFLHLFKFWFVIAPYEQGHTFHFGSVGKPIAYNDGWFGSGFHLTWPLGITDVLYYDITEDSHEIDIQDLTTRDGHAIRVAGVFRFKVRADKAYEHLVVLGDGSTAVTDFLGAAMAEVVENSNLDSLFDPGEDRESLVVDEARRMLNRYGYKVLDFHWVNKVAPQRVWRVIT
jgi:hypothetical protein